MRLWLIDILISPVLAIQGVSPAEVTRYQGQTFVCEEGPLVGRCPPLCLRRHRFLVLVFVGVNVAWSSNVFTSSGVLENNLDIRWLYCASWKSFVPLDLSLA